MGSVTNVRTVFISDVHLGSRYAAAKDLLDFLKLLKDHRPDKIYIVGDFIDGWKLKRNWFWNNDSNQILRRLLGFSKKGTEIFYVAGNHDDFLREFIQGHHLLEFGNIMIGNEFVHQTADGRKLLVTHGDMFDLVTTYAKWLCVLGDIGYEILLHLNRFVKWTRRLLGLPHWSLSQAIKRNVKKAVSYVADFEHCLATYAREKDCVGCICGHIHHADLKELSGGFVYANTGDWVESCTAIYEDQDGQLHLYRHHG